MSGKKLIGQIHGAEELGSGSLVDKESLPEKADQTKVLAYSDHVNLHKLSLISVFMIKMQSIHFYIFDNNNWLLMELYKEQ